VYNQSKSYAALNISRPEGLEMAMSLVALSDIVVENFAAGVVERLGLGYEAIREVNPNVIMISSSGTGHSGPDKHYVAYGSLLQHYTGWNTVSGYPGQEPIKGGLWADPWVGMELTMVAVAALNHRVVTGEGQYIDFSMAEALSASIPEAILHYQMNGAVKEPMGNDDDWNSPHGMYHCKGSDSWVAIAVTTNQEWKALCCAIGKPELASKPGFDNAEVRRDHRDEIDAAISQWTSQHDDYDAAEILQNAGIPAGPSLDVSRVYNDPHLRSSGYLYQVKTNDGEIRDLPSLPWRFEGQSGPRIAAAPDLAQDNDRIYRELLGLSESEIAQLVEDQIIY
jgi:crotonobetainyl-CoA:carnitine CoA-transferase CaiB-like acyl-CoA transferase|tara:strand:+ start:3537 stop:4550 length:1014 start_codon:yes stop_codon:yes gene_type:complete